MTKQIVIQPNEVHCDDLYDPNHPDADWSGFVSLRSKRKHIPSKPNQIVAIDGNGYGPTTDVETEEWTKPARKIVGHRESGATDDDEQDDHGIRRSSTFTLIGGPVPVQSPSKFAPKCWETEAQAGARRKKTDLQQLTDHGRCMHVSGRRRPELKKVEEEDSNNVMETKSANDESCTVKDPSDLVGFRVNFTKLTSTDPSILREVGDVVAKMPKRMNPNDLLSSAPFATQVGPIDPYMNASGERRKDMLVENYSSVVPGYTGKRTFIN